MWEPPLNQLGIHCPIHDKLQSPQYTKYQNKAYNTVQKPDQINLNYICCTRICNDMGLTATSSCPLSTWNSTGSTAYPLVAQALLRALTLAIAKTFPVEALLISVGYTHAEPMITDPCPTKPAKHNAISSWPAGSRISQTCCHSLPGPL